MTSIRVKPNQTPVTEKADEMKTMKETQKNITEIYNELSYDDLNEVLKNWLNQDSGVKDEEVTTPVETKKATNNMPSQAEVSDVSSAFDELFSS